MNVVKNDRNSERYFERLSARSSAQNSVRLAATEIVVKGCSCVLGLPTTGKSDTMICYNGSCPLNFNKISKASRAG